MENWWMLIYVVIIIAAIVFVRLVRRSGNRKVAQSGEDKERLRKAAEPLLAGNGNGQVLYAHWEDRTSYGRTVRTTYYRYVVTYQDQNLCVAPLHIDKKTGEIQAGQPVVFTPESLGKITVNTKEKDGSVVRMEIQLVDKQGENLFQMFVDAESLRQSRWYPVNILQHEECAAFEGFTSSLAQRIAAENPGVDDLIKENDNAGTGIIGAIISVIGAVFAIFFPPAGIILSLIGLILCIVSKAKGAKSNKSLIVSIICMVLSAGLLWMFFTYFI